VSWKDRRGGRRESSRGGARGEEDVKRNAYLRHWRGSDWRRVDRRILELARGIPEVLQQLRKHWLHCRQIDRQTDRQTDRHLTNARYQSFDGQVNLSVLACLERIPAILLHA
jgi:hypothetical protein